MAKDTAHADDDNCANCGACKHCGAGGRPQFVPMPYPVYPRPNYWPHIAPNTSPFPYTVWSGTQQHTSISPQFTSGANQSAASALSNPFPQGFNH